MSALKAGREDQGTASDDGEGAHARLGHGGANAKLRDTVATGQGGERARDQAHTLERKWLWMHFCVPLTGNGPWNLTRYGSSALGQQARSAIQSAKESKGGTEPESSQKCSWGRPSRSTSEKCDEKRFASKSVSALGRQRAPNINHPTYSPSSPLDSQLIGERMPIHRKWLNDSNMCLSWGFSQFGEASATRE